jgi:hypothetical protein
LIQRLAFPRAAWGKPHDRNLAACRRRASLVPETQHAASGAASYLCYLAVTTFEALARNGRKPAEATLAETDAPWNEAKRGEKGI